MATVLRARWDQLVVLVQAQLVASTGLPPERVLVQEDETLPEVTQAEQVLLVWEGVGEVDEAIWQGASRVDSRLLKRFTVVLWTRCYLDEPTSSVIWLTDPDLGHAVWRHKVYEALVSFIPTDSHDNWLGLPVIPLGETKPSRDTDQREWGSSKLTFGVVFELDLTLTPNL